MRNYTSLSFTEYEKLIGDLFSAELGVRFERFGSGSDGGIDLRHLKDDTGPSIIQTKHYLGSTWSNLKTAASDERKRLGKLDPSPGEYRFVTSQHLTPVRKTALTSLLSPYIVRDDDVFGGEEVDDMLDRHAAVERRHVKLWLASAAGLRAMVHAGVHARSREMAAEIARKLPLWVQNDTFLAARERLAAERVLVISGQPGIGKTTLAQILVAHAIELGYEPVGVSTDVEEAWGAFDPSAKQVFLYDDFLGQTSLVELTKNEDSRLVSLMREVARSENKMLVLTTREYILQRASQVSEALRRQGLSSSRILLELPSYSPLDRARILANHVWHSAHLGREVRTELASDRGYSRITDHANYNPRLIEYITANSGHARLDGQGSRLERSVAALDEPDEIWRTAYERQLSDVERGLLLMLATFTRRAKKDDLELAHDAWCFRPECLNGPGASNVLLRWSTTPSCPPPWMKGSLSSPSSTPAFVTSSNDSCATTRACRRTCSTASCSSSSSTRCGALRAKTAATLSAIGLCGR